MKVHIKIAVIAAGLLAISCFSHAQETPRPDSDMEENGGVVQSAETPSARITAIKDELSRSDKKDILKEIELLRKLNAEIESYIPALKERNNRLEAEAESLQKEKDYVLKEVKDLKAMKGVVKKNDFEKLKKENKRLSTEVNRLERANDKLQSDVRKARSRQIKDLPKNRIETAPQPAIAPASPEEEPAEHDGE